MRVRNRETIININHIYPDFNAAFSFLILTIFSSFLDMPFIHPAINFPHLAPLLFKAYLYSYLFFLHIKYNFKSTFSIQRFKIIAKINFPFFLFYK